MSGKEIYLRLKPGADKVGVKKSLEEGFMETGIEDSVHKINYRAIDPNMTPNEREALRLELLTMHVDFQGMRIIFPDDQGFRQQIDMMAETPDLQKFVSYARWRLNGAPVVTEDIFKGKSTNKPQGT